MIECQACGQSGPAGGSSCVYCGATPANVDGFVAYAPGLARKSKGFRAEYFSQLIQIEEANFWFRARNHLILWAIRRYFPHLTSLLEVGCGTGFVLAGVSKAFPSVRLVGSEVFTVGLEFASRRIPEASFVQADGRCLPFIEEFDVVAAFDVVEHIKEDAAVFESLYRAVKPGGGLLISVPQHRWLWSAADDYACHVRRYAASDLHNLIRNVGFEVVRSTSFVSTLLPAMLFSRLRIKAGKSSDPMAEFLIHPRLNQVLEAFMNIDLAFIRCGIDFPVGGSRLVVARKPGLASLP